MRLTIPDGPFFREMRGDTLPSTQIDVGTVSKFVRDQAASPVRGGDRLMPSTLAARGRPLRSRAGG